MAIRDLNEDIVGAGKWLTTPVRPDPRAQMSKQVQEPFPFRTSGYNAGQNTGGASGSWGEPETPANNTITGPDVRPQPQGAIGAAATGQGGGGEIAGLQIALKELMAQYTQLGVDDTKARELALIALERQVAPKTFDGQAAWDKASAEAPAVAPVDNYGQAIRMWTGDIMGGAGLARGDAYRAKEEARVRQGNLDRDAGISRKLGFARDMVTGENTANEFENTRDATRAKLAGMTSTPVLLKGAEAKFNAQDKITGASAAIRTANKPSQFAEEMSYLTPAERKMAVASKYARGEKEPRAVSDAEIKRAGEAFDASPIMAKFGENKNNAAAIAAERNIVADEVRAGMTVGNAMDRSIERLKKQLVK